MSRNNKKIAVVIPCYKVKEHILDVINAIDSDIDKIYIVDDCCPDGSGGFVFESCDDQRIHIIKNENNMGVGGAVIAGYKQAVKDNMDVIVKLDGDNQMNPAIMGKFLTPIIESRADYVKGNRFFDPRMLMEMPTVRLFGNAVLSFVNKLSSGYWNIMDPTNGYTAISANILRILPMDKLDNRYFFESDMLFRLGTVGAVVYDIPMHSVYGDEKSHLNIFSVAVKFPAKYLRSFIKRIFYRYFLRDFNIGSLSLLFGSCLMLFSMMYGSYMWYQSIETGIPATSGTVMVAGLPAILGIQLLLFFLNYDILNVPRDVIGPYIE